MKCIFLDRDGVLNKERGDYTYRLEDFELIEGVPQALADLKKQGYLLVVITNQAGISRGIYTREQMQACHAYMDQETGGIIDAIYYSPYHPTVTESISRKPDTLLFEKAIARFGIDPKQSWMIGDRDRDLIPAQKFGIRTIKIGELSEETVGEFTFSDLKSAARLILETHKKTPAN